LLASGDSAKWPKGFNTASDAMWANNYTHDRREKNISTYRDINFFTTIGIPCL